MKLGSSTPRRKPTSGFALVLVLGILVLLTVLVVAFFTSVTTDYASSKQYSSGAATKQLADSVVQIAMGQIKLATAGTNPSAVGSTVAWASQPGMIRTYDDTGTELTNYKLYSSGAMTTSGPLSLLQVSDYDAAWRTKTAAWTDLNAPVTDATGTVNFPIIDGNKMASLTLPGGTSASLTYDGINNASGGTTPDGVPDVQGFAVNLPATFTYDAAKPLSPKNTPVPMPVTWLYQLADGTLIAPDASSTTTATFTSVPAARQPGPTNPIVGRVAFWTDDETSKLNINTACGDEWNPAQITPGTNPAPAGSTAYTPPGSYWDVPRAFTSYDYNNLALLQPAQHEYQRYPGHPATIYLSAVFPNATRDQLFGLVPRLGGGGSQGGTALPANTLTTDTDRLYASVDELMFLPTVTGAVRNANDPSKSLLTRSGLERAKFFLTANSRAPEVNLFNKPRIAVWPVDQDVVAKQGTSSQSPRGTAFDHLIAFCAHLGSLGSGNDYIFQRSDKGYLSQTKDYDLATTGGGQRNHLLYAYLQNLAGANIPGFGSNFETKFGTDKNQVLTEIFDYIRCVNPSDDNIAFKTTDTVGNPPGSPTNDSFCYTPNERYTNTLLAGGYNTGKVLTPQPYHNFIAPTRIDSTQGFGRTVTISEIGLSFICNADGSAGTFSAPVTPGPLPAAPSPVFYTLESNQPYPMGDTRAMGHARNVNLVQNTPLTATQRRVQAILFLNPYTVSPGYSTMHMDIGIEITGLDGIMVNGRSIGFPTDKTIVMSNPTYRTPTFGMNFPFFFNSYFAPVQKLMDAATQTIGDPNPPTINPIRTITPTNSRYPPFRTYEFISSPFTVDASAGTMTLAGGSSVVVKIWHLSPADVASGTSIGTPSSSSTLIQTFPVDLSALNATPWPIPTLVTSVDTSLVHDAVPPETLWDFSWAGVFGDYNNNAPGRLFDWVGNSGHYIESNIVSNDVIRTMVPGFPTDTIGVGGDYRLLAAINNTITSPFVPHRLSTDAPLSPYISSLSILYFNGWQLQAIPNLTDLGQTPLQGAQSSFGALITSVPLNAKFGGNINTLIPAQTGDYDNGMGSDMDGPYINKPDTGYQYQSTASQQTYPYFEHFAENSSAAFFSPNRQIASPGMFGSLPVGVKRLAPWQTLLFRPQPTHPGGVPVPDVNRSSANGAPYGPKVADHLIMDWFWMPVVEPYAISEPFSTAGKVNMNYQLAPFTYITRATALDALLKSQRLLAIPNLPTSLNWKHPLGYSGTGGGAPPAADYRYDLNLSLTDGTLRQFEETFGAGDVFRSPTQICDIYLTPKGQSWARNADAETFWSNNKLTGDNSRERPYTNLYGCLTTKSNTYTVHFRVQSLQKVPGTPVAQWVDGRDAVVGDTRGSTLIERYVDPGDTSLPDFTTNSSAVLDNYYKFRVVSTKKFAP